MSRAKTKGKPDGDMPEAWEVLASAFATLPPRPRMAADAHSFAAELADGVHPRGARCIVVPSSKDGGTHTFATSPVTESDELGAGVDLEAWEEAAALQVRPVGVGFVPVRLAASFFGVAHEHVFAMIDDHLVEGRMIENVWCVQLYEVQAALTKFYCRLI